MSLDTGRAYEALQCAYRNGVLDKVVSIQGEAMQGLMRKKGLNLNEFINRVDEMDEEKLQKLDAILQRSNLLFWLMTSDCFMRLISRLLKFRIVRKILIWFSEILYSWLINTSRKVAVANG